MKKCFSPLFFDRKNFVLDRLIRDLFIFSVALSPLGPVFHYTLWGVCLILIFYKIIKEKSFSQSKLSGWGKGAYLCFCACCLWTAVAGLPTLGSFHDYGRNISMILEIVIGISLTIYTLRSEEDRQCFIRVFCC